jgi:D-sedoheptulose 7-phosphate isomerase
MKNSKNGDRVEYVDKFLKGVIEICENISQKDLDNFINILFKAWFEQRTIFICGNGGSASTASHFTADLNNCLSDIEEAHMMKVICLNDNMARYSALVNDRGWENVYTEQLRNYFKPGDVVIGISVHGGAGKEKAGVWSQNILKALQFSKDNGGKALGLSGFDGGAFNQVCDVNVVVPFNTTPHVEGFHMVLHHLIYDAIPRKVAAFIEASKRI